MANKKPQSKIVAFVHLSLLALVTVGSWTLLLERSDMGQLSDVVLFGLLLCLLFWLTYFGVRDYSEKSEISELEWWNLVFWALCISAVVGVVLTSGNEDLPSRGGMVSLALSLVSIAGFVYGNLHGSSNRRLALVERSLEEAHQEKSTMMRESGERVDCLIASAEILGKAEMRLHDARSVIALNRGLLEDVRDLLGFMKTQPVGHELGAYTNGLEDSLRQGVLEAARCERRLERVNERIQIHVDARSAKLEQEIAAGELTVKTALQR